MSEPTFRIDIRTCYWAHLSMEELTRKLKLMHDLRLINSYTIREDTNEPIETPKPVEKP